MKLLVINGPNLNLLGLREPAIYGKGTYAELEKVCYDAAEEFGCTIEIRQSNHEGVLIDWIQEAYGVFDGIVINPAGYTHTSIAIMDALKAITLPAIEVHLSDVSLREPFRHISYAGMACIRAYKGLGFEGYRQAIAYLCQYLRSST